MRQAFLLLFYSGAFVSVAAGQTAVNLPRSEERQKQQKLIAREQQKQALRSNVEFRGERAFSEKELRSQLKEQLATVERLGLSPARADDVAFFLELFYRKHGYPKVNVHYAIEEGRRLRLDIEEGPLVTLAQVNFVGNASQPSEKLFEYAVGPTRERYSKLQKNLPFVTSDIEEGASLVHRLYIAEGFLDVVVDPPRYVYVADGTQVNVTLVIHEGQRYSFGHIAFVGHTIYGDEAVLGQILDLLNQPYTDARVDDIQRRLQAFYRARGYFEADVDATGDPLAAPNGRVPVRVTIEPGRLYHFDGVTVTGLQRLRPSYITRRFRKLNGKTYSPDVLDAKFRELMRTGLFNLLQIKPVPVSGDLLRLDVSADEAKSKEFGFSIGYGSFVGGIVGVQYRDRDLFGYGRPLTTSVEISERSYKGEILYEDPYLFDTDFALKSDLSALTYDFDGYSKFEVGGRFDLTRQITKQYKAGLVFAVRHVEITTNDIRPPELAGRTSYLVNTIGFTQTLDLRDSPVIPTRGFIFDNTFDLASSGIGSQIDFVRSTFRASYYLSFAKPPPAPSDIGTGLAAGGKPTWFEQSSLAFGARTGIIHSLNASTDEALAIPIDERFFNGGSTTVRSFGERDLGPHDRRGNPLGGEFFTIFNVEYTFPIFGELQGAVFTDAGNLLPSSEDVGLNDMRYAIGAGLRYKLPIGPIRLDYGVNPDPHPDEDFGALNFSFGFAF